jgi:hypothetical protein
MFGFGITFITKKITIMICLGGPDGLDPSGPALSLIMTKGLRWWLYLAEGAPRPLFAE